MAEKYFDTQALLGVVIRDPKIFGADITGKRLSISENYDYPDSGNPFVPGYTYSVDPLYGFSIGFMSGPSAGGMIFSIEYHDGANKSAQDSLNFFGMINGDFLRGTMPAGTIYAVRDMQGFTDPVTGMSEARGVEVGGELIVTDRAIRDPWTPWAGTADSYGGTVNRRGSVGVASRTSYSSNSYPGQIVMRSYNMLDPQFPDDYPVIEFDRTGSAYTPKIGMTASGDQLKIASGNLNPLGARSSITLGTTGVLISGPLIINTPTIAGHAATKGYVDGVALSGVPGTVRLVGITHNTGNSGNVTATEAVVISISQAVTAGRTYRVTLSGQTDASVATDVISMKVRANTTQIKAGSAQANSSQTSAFASNSQYLTGYWTAPSSATVTFDATLARAIGTGNVRFLGSATSPFTLSVEEIIP